MQPVYSDPDLAAAVGPRIRKSAFFDSTVGAGLVSVSCYNHTWIPMSYGDPDAEYRRLTETVAMWDVAAQRHLQVTGPDAGALVDYVTAVSTSTIVPATGAYAPMVDHDGTLINDPILLRFDDEEWRFSMADADIGLWVRAIGRERRSDCIVRELDTATLALQGPNAEAVMNELDVDVTDMDDLAMRTVSINGTRVTVSRSGWSSQDGYELFLDDPRDAARLWATVEAAGQSHGIGPGAPNPSERIENVLLSYGTDTGYDADPFELGLESVVDLDKQDYIGRNALLRIRDEGVARRLCGVVIEGSRIDTLAHPVAVSSGPDILGQLRSAAWSPQYRSNLGLALLAVDVEPGTRATAMLPVGLRTIRTVAVPFDRSEIGHGS